MVEYLPGMEKQLNCKKPMLSFPIMYYCFYIVGVTVIIFLQNFFHNRYFFYNTDAIIRKILI